LIFFIELIRYYRRRHFAFSFMPPAALPSTAPLSAKSAAHADLRRFAASAPGFFLPLMPRARTPECFDFRYAATSFSPPFHFRLMLTPAERISRDQLSS
jgi:hypothetical protein